MASSLWSKSYREVYRKRELRVFHMAPGDREASIRALHRFAPKMSPSVRVEQRGTR